MKDIADLDRRALEQFVIQNDDLLRLEGLIGRFNIFDALSVSHVEIRHSNFLAFILDPAESHGQGQLFLKALLMDILRAAPIEKRPISPVDLDGDDLQGVRVRREWQSIDLLITCEHPRFLIAIENKIYATEHSDQLIRYTSTIEREFPGVPALYAFLTPDARVASHDQWVTYSYGEIHHVLSRVRDLYQSVIGDDVLVFLNHYLSLIGNRFMNDPAIDDLCRRIFKNHRRALQLIFERAGDPTGGVLADIREVIRKDDRWEQVYFTKTYLDFLPKDWLPHFPAVGIDYKELRALIVCRFELYDGKLTYYVQVNRMPDEQIRRLIVKRLLKEGERFGLFRKSSLKFKDNYTRISSKELVETFDPDRDYATGELDEKIRTKLDSIYSKLQPMAESLVDLLTQLAPGNE